jgi:hypothetical protein
MLWFIPADQPRIRRRVVSCVAEGRVGARTRQELEVPMHAPGVGRRSDALLATPTVIAKPPDPSRAALNYELERDHQSNGRAVAGQD